jgi:hypothetical protein
MPDTVEAPVVDVSKMSPEQRLNWEKTVAAHQPVETAEAKSIREKAERDARVEHERRDQICKRFVLKHADDFAPSPYNSQAIMAEMAEQEFTVENLEKAFEKLTKLGQLLPPPYKEPVAVEKQFDYMGLTFKKLQEMSPAEYKAKYNDPVYRPVFDQIVLDHNQNRGKK